MANRIDIIAEGISLDLLPGTEKKFYISLVVYDLSNLETRNSTFSKQINLPPTPKNQAFFGIQPPLIGGRPPNAYKRVGIEILIDGIPLQRDLEGLYIGIEDGFYQFQIFGSAASFYDSLSDNLIGDLDLSEVDFDMTVANVNTKMTTNDNKLMTPFLDYLTFDAGVDIDTDLLGNGWFLKDYNIRYAGFVVFAKWLIQKIIESVGYTVDYSAISNSTFEALVLVAPVFQFVELPDPNLSVGNYQKGNSQNMVAITVPVRISWTVQLTAPFGATWSGATNYQYAFTATAIIDIVLKIDYTYTYNASRVGATWVRITKNGIGIAYKFFNAIDAGSAVYTLTVTGHTINSSDLLYVEAIVAPNSGGGTADVLQLNTNSEFGFLEQSSSNVSIDVEQWLPEVEQRKFVITIMKMFNFIINVNPISRTVEISDFDDVFTSEPQDLSDYIDNSIEAKISTQFGSLAQISRFKWPRDANVIRTDGDAQYLSANTTLPPDSTVIELDGFSISDQSEFAPTRNGSLKIKHPNFTVESLGIQGQISSPGAGTAFTISESGAGAIKGGDFRTGDYIYIPSPVDRVYYINTLTANNSAGTVIEAFTGAFTRLDYQVWRYTIGNAAITPRLGVITLHGSSRYIHDGKDESTRVTNTTGYEVQFTNAIDWGTLKDNYYASMLNMLDRVVRVKIWAYLPTFIMYNLSLTRKIYIRKYDSYFYINKIEQWKPTGKVRLDLILMTKDFELTS